MASPKLMHLHLRVVSYGQDCESAEHGVQPSLVKVPGAGEHDLDKLLKMQNGTIAVKASIE